MRNSDQFKKLPKEKNAQSHSSGLNGQKRSIENGWAKTHKNGEPKTLEGQWAILKSRFLQKYPILTHEDLDYRRLGFDTMFRRLTAKTGISKNQLRDEIINWEEGPINQWPEYRGRLKKK